MGALASEKVSFVVNYRVFYLAVVSDRCALTPAVRQYFFRQCPPCLIMFWHDFGRGGGEHYGHHVCMRDSSSISLSYLC
jgi:hypothetical protein